MVYSSKQSAELIIISTLDTHFQMTHGRYGYLIGQTYNNVEMVSFNNAVYQSVVGTDKVVYLRHTTTIVEDNNWSAWEPVRDVNNKAISTASTFVELSVSNNNLIVASTDAQSHPILGRLLSPMNNAQISPAIDTNSIAKYNSLSTIDNQYAAGN